MTPNLLARTIETVEGGGLVVLLLRKLASLTSLCTMVMVGPQEPIFIFSSIVLFNSLNSQICYYKY